MRTINTEFYGDDVRWFVGEVKDINDPDHLGRIRVRIFGIHTNDNVAIAKDHLPWASVVLPVTQGGISNSTSPTGIQVGAQVFGIFMDGKHSQIPLILGSIPFNPALRVAWDGPGAIELPLTNTDGQRWDRFYQAGDIVDTTTNYTLSAAGLPEAEIGSQLTQEQADALNGSTPVSAHLPTTLVGRTHQEQAFNELKSYFTARGHSDPGIIAAAFVGNFINESGPNLPGNAGPTYKGIVGTHTRWGQEQSFGIAQWNLAAGRMGHLETFAARHGTNWADFALQLKFVEWELENSFSYVWTRLRNNHTIQSATETVMRFYEIPYVAVQYNRYQSNRSQFSTTNQNSIVRAYRAELNERIADAREVFDTYGGS